MWVTHGPAGRISYSLDLNPVTTSTVYTGTDDGVFKSVDSAMTWTASNNGFPMDGGSPRTAFALVHDPQATVPGILYVGVDVGEPANVGTQVLKSIDGGASWNKLPFPATNVVAIAISPAQPSVVVAISVQGQQGLVYRSEDGGKSWGQRQ